MMLADQRRDDAAQPPIERVISDATRSHIRTLRAKADELRTSAAGAKNEHTRRLLWNAAANYDRFADEADRKG